MSVSILSSFLLTCSVVFTQTATSVPSSPPTHTLAIKIHEGGQLLINGRAVGDTVLQLNNANVATIAEAGNTLFSVTQPDGGIFYKGDFTLAVQSISTGTTKIRLQGGEAILSKTPELRN